MAVDGPGIKKNLLILQNKVIWHSILYFTTKITKFSV